jgi:hypothetical protein
MGVVDFLSAININAEKLDYEHRRDGRGAKSYCLDSAPEDVRERYLAWYQKGLEARARKDSCKDEWRIRLKKKQGLHGKSLLRRRFYELYDEKHQTAAESSAVYCYAAPHDA